MVCEGSEWSNKIIAPLFGEIAAKLLIVSLNGQKHPEHFSYWEKIFSLDSDPLLIMEMKAGTAGSRLRLHCVNVIN